MKRVLFVFCLFCIGISLLSCTSPGIINAVNTGSLAEVDGALANGSEVNARDDAGNTPLILAAKHGDLAIVQLLVKRGADIQTRNNEGYDAVLALMDYSLPRTTSARQQSSKIGITLEGHLKTAEFLLNNGANVNGRTRDGDTPLMRAAALDKTQLVELLLAKGAEVNGVNGEGKTALMMATMNGSGEVACLLLRRGADPAIKDKNGMTAANHAEKGENKEAAQRGLNICAVMPADPKSGEKSAPTKLGDKKTVIDIEIEKQVGALRDPELTVRTDAARKLGELNDLRAVIPLINAMADEHAYVRRRAAVSLGNLGDLRGAEALIKGLKDEDTFVQHYSLQALEKITGQKLGTNTRQWQEWWSRTVRQQ